MGTICGVCKNHQPFRRAITATGEPAVKGEDVIGYELGCGHLMVGGDMAAYNKEIASIKTNTYSMIEKLKRKMIEEMAKAFESQFGEKKK